MVTKESSEPGRPPEGTEAAIAALWQQMVARDQGMWEQLTQRDNVLQDKMIDLFSRLLEANSVDRVLVAGFSEVADQLRSQMEPLRELTRPLTTLPEDYDMRLAGLRAALSRPDYSRPPENEAPWVSAVGQTTFRSLTP